MNPSSESSLCTKCGSPLDVGNCPRCLMLAAMQPTEGGDRPPAVPLAEVVAAFPHLEILDLIGQGGMGTVFKVRQPKLNRLAALKLLPASLAGDDPAFGGRFEREGELLAKLHHPNIVTIHDSGVAGGFYYLLMEFVDGVNLRQAMRSARLTPGQALAIVPKVCDALQFAHDEGVLHRDIKPENILLDSRGRVKLVDFGIAKLTGEKSYSSHRRGAPDDPYLTQGFALGTPGYMAPEQHHSPSNVDHRADIYSLGVVFYELLTGELPTAPFDPPSTKSDSDPRIDAIVRQALEQERSYRQQSASEVKTQVETLVSPQLSPAPESLRRGMPVAALATVFSIIGAWMHTTIDGTGGTPVWKTTVGILSPWMGESATPRTEGGDFQRVISMLAGPLSPSAICMLLAGGLWFSWIHLKRRSNAPLDGSLRDEVGRFSPEMALGLWCGASALFLWLFVAVVGAGSGLFTLLTGKVIVSPVPLVAVQVVAIVTGTAWIWSRVLASRRGETPRPFSEAGAGLYRLVEGIGVLVLAALMTFVAVFLLRPLVSIFYPALAADRSQAGRFAMDRAETLSTLSGAVIGIFVTILIVRAISRARHDSGGLKAKRGLQHKSPPPPSPLYRAATWICVSVCIAAPVIYSLYRWDTSVNRGFEFGYYGEFNRVRHAIERLPGSSITAEVTNKDIGLEEFSFTIRTGNGRLVTLGFLESDPIRGLSGASLARALDRRIQDATAPTDDEIHPAQE